MATKTFERLFDDGSGKMKISRGNIYEYLGINLELMNQEKSR